LAQQRHARSRFLQIFIAVSGHEQHALVHSESSPTRGASMSKFTTALIAAAVAALAALAVVALPAIGDSGAKGTDNHGPGLSALAACLAAHGLPGAPSSGTELKPWLASKSSTEPDRVGTAMDACQSDVPQRDAPGPEIQAIITCVRGHGVDAPSAPDDFKRWIGQQQQAGAPKALNDALTACKMSLAPDTKARAGAKAACGEPAGKLARPADKPKMPVSPGARKGT